MEKSRELKRWMLGGGVTLNIILAFMAWLIFSKHHFGFPLDDSWIHLVYARCFFEHAQFCYNEGILSTGDSSPLWVLCISLLYGLTHHFGTNVYVASIHIFNAFLYLLIFVYSLCLTWEITRDATPVKWMAFFLCFNPILIYHAFSGMEMYLCLIFLLWSALSFIKRYFWRCGVFLALACCVRPESAAVGVVYWIYLTIDSVHTSATFSNFFFVVIPRLVCGIQKIKKLNLANKSWGESGFRKNAKLMRSCISVFLPYFKILLPCIFLGGIWIAFNYHASRHFFPAPYYFKQTMDQPHFLNRFYYVYGSLLSVFVGASLFNWPLLSIFYFKKNIPQWNKNILLSFWIGISFISFNALLVGFYGFSFYLLRYVIPGIPFIMMTIVIAAWLMATTLHKRWPYYYLLLIMAFTLSLSYSSMRFGLRSFDYMYDLDMAAALWVEDHVPPNTTAIAISDAGIMRYYTSQFIVDTVGLNTPEFIWDHKNFIKQHPVSLIYVWTDGFWYKTTAQDKVYLTKLAKFHNVEKFSTTLYTCAHDHNIHFQDIVHQVSFVRSFDVNCEPLKSTTRN